MITRIAWRNIWRNKRRSWVLITAVAAGFFAFLGGMSIVTSFEDQMLDNAVRFDGGHVQIAADGYHENPNVRRAIDDPAPIAAALQGVPGIAHESLVQVDGMATSARRSLGVMITGVDPDAPVGTAHLRQSLVEGEMLGGTAEGRVLISTKLADQLSLEVGQRLVLMAADRTNEIQSAAFRIGGLFRTGQSAVDDRRVFVHHDDARQLAAYDTEVTSFAIFADDEDALDAAVASITAALEEAGIATANLEILTWQQRMGFLSAMYEVVDVFSVVLLIILFTAVALSLVNSFLMVIFERMRELGVMMANGVRPGQIKRMLYLEASFIVSIGLAIGGALSVGLVAYFSGGMDLAMFAEGLGDFGVGSVLYPRIDMGDLLLGLIGITVIVFLAILYPARKAAQFEIVDALRHT